MIPGSVLIVAYSFPPRGGVGGMRAARLARGLSRRGWRVTVLTADPAENPAPATLAERPVDEPRLKIIGAPSRGCLALLRTALGRNRGTASGETAVSGASPPPLRPRLWLALRELALFPDDQADWIRGAVEAGRILLAQDPHDVIISTSPPESCHRVAMSLARSTGTPWIADFRDPWAFSHLREPSWLDQCHRFAERKTLQCVHAIVTVTEGWVQRFRERYPEKACYLVRNGHDRGTSRRSGPGGQFQVLYTGKLDLTQQDPQPFLDGLRLWLQRTPEPEVEVTFSLYGEGSLRTEQWLRAAKLPLRLTGPVGQTSSIAAQDRASVLLLFPWRTDPACVPAKLYDYLGARRRVLVVGDPASEPARLVRELNVGVAATDPKEVATILEAWYTNWASGEVEPAGAQTAFEAFSFEKRAAEYDSLLQDLMTRTRG